MKKVKVAADLLPKPVITSSAPKRTESQEKFLSRLKKDDVFVKSEIKSLAELTGMPVKKGISNVVVVEGKIVHAVSPTYGFMPNEKYFYEVERALIEADIQYVTNSVNRDNTNFKVDYILNDDSYHVELKNINDRILPMISFTSSLDGGPQTGSFGFYREVCSNSLHIAQTKVGFKVLHRSKITELILPNIKTLVETFMSNEYYELRKKFDVMHDTPIKDIKEFVKFTCNETGLDLFKFAASEKNPDTPSKTAKEVMATIEKEAKALETEPNLWLGYNAFNEVINKTKKAFGTQRRTDIKLFDAVLEMVN